ncbi:MAG: RNA polymerase sigma factor [Verrucomicrobia bacterium]|nr:RNA polymerase sigma factor [Verrucomicrobiota bacterium]
MQEELEQLYDQHAQSLFAFLLSFTRNETDTRDLLQEVLLRIAQRPGLLHGIREPRAFLLRLAHNLAIDHIRRHKTREKHNATMEAEQPTPFAPSQRAVVHLKLWEGMTFEQIAGLLEIPPNTAASRYRYGLDKMRELLRPLYDEIT